MMAVFEYVAKDKSGNEFSGVYTDIDSKTNLRRELSKMDYTLVKAHKQRGGVEQKRSKVKSSEVIAFTYEFAGMYSAGLSILRCLETFEEQVENGAFKDIINDVKQSVETGTTLKEAFEKYRKIFSDFFLGMVEAGETGGKLGETLQMAAVYLEKQDELKRKVQSAFAYPVVVCVMCFLIVSALIVFVIPVFQKLYSQLHITLPLPTLILIAISTAVRQYWWIVVPSITGLIFGIRFILKRPEVKPVIDSMKLNMPVFGKLNKMVVVSRFVRTFAMMASAGVAIVEALEIAQKVANNVEMEKIGQKMQDDIATGNPLVEPMMESDIFPPMIIQLAAAGEEAGILPEMLTKGVDFLDKQIDRSIKSMLVKIEPVLSIVLGLIVGGIMLGVYLPMFDYMSQVK